jgi:hypothetical protein
LLQGAVLLLPPLQAIFSVGNLGLWGWGAVLVLSLVPAAVCELGKGR